MSVAKGLQEALGFAQCDLKLLEDKLQDLEGLRAKARKHRDGILTLLREVLPPEGDEFVHDALPGVEPYVAGMPEVVPEVLTLESALLAKGWTKKRVQHSQLAVSILSKEGLFSGRLTKFEEFRQWMYSTSADGKLENPFSSGDLQALRVAYGFERLNPGTFHALLHRMVDSGELVRAGKLRVPTGQSVNTFVFADLEEVPDQSTEALKYLRPVEKFPLQKVGVSKTTSLRRQTLWLLDAGHLRSGFCVSELRYMLGQFDPALKDDKGSRVFAVLEQLCSDGVLVREGSRGGGSTNGGYRYHTPAKTPVSQE